MKMTALLVAAAVAFASPTLARGQGEPGPPPADAAKEALAGRFDSDARSPDARQAARDRLALMAKAYRGAAGMTDRASISVSAMGQAPRRDAIAITLGAGTDAMLEWLNAKAYSSGGMVTFVPTFPGDKALQGPLVAADGSSKGATLVSSLARLVPGFSIPAPHFALRALEEGAPVPLGAVVFDTVASPEIAGYLESDGVGALLLTGANGSLGVLDIALDTNLLRGATFHFTAGGPEAGMPVTVGLTYAPAIAEAPAPIVADIGGRTVVRTLAELAPKRVNVGEPCPDITLTLPDGTPLALSSLRGRSAILTFVSTSDPPSRRLLPYIDQAARWATESGAAVSVYAVNTLENGDAATRRSVTDEYWRAQGFALPLALDLDDSAFRAFGFDGLPVTVVVAPDGTIAHIHTGLDAKNPGGIVETLKAQAAGTGTR